SEPDHLERRRIPQTIDIKMIKVFEPGRAGAANAEPPHDDERGAHDAPPKTETLRKAFYERGFARAKIPAQSDDNGMLALRFFGREGFGEGLTEALGLH